MAEWKKVKIGGFLKVRQGKYKPDDEAIANLKRLNKIDFSGRIHLSDKPTKTDMIIVNSGDLVISGINVAKGAIAVHQDNEPITATIHYSSYQFDDTEIDIDFLKRFLRSPAFISALKEQVKGGIKTEIKAKSLLSISVRLPELAEQKTINSRFQKFENELVELDCEISKQQTYLTKLRQAILQEAIEGKLTADWRVKNPVEKGNPDTDATALLATIKAEKQKLIADGKIKTTKKQESIVEDDLISSIPESWNYVHLDDISLQITDGTHQTPTYTKEGRIFLSAQNIKPFKFMPDNHKFVSESAYHAYVKTAKAGKGDLLIGRVGAGIGETAVVDREMDFAIYVSLGLIKPFKQLNSNFLCFIFNSPYGVRYAKGNISSGGGSAGNFNLGRIRSFSIPLPPLAEQHAIVERVDRLLASVNALEQQVKERKTYAEQLMQAVLKEAFAG